MARQIVSFHLNDAGDSVFVYAGASDELQELEAIVAVADPGLAVRCGDMVQAFIMNAVE